MHNEPPQPYRAPAPITSSYTPIGRPIINASKPSAPPTPVGTSYASKRDELAEIRKQHEPETRGIPAQKIVTPPVVRTPAPTAVPSAPVVASSAPPATAPPAPAREKEERPAAVVRPLSLSLPLCDKLKLKMLCVIQGTAYTPISLPKPGKLANRWGQPQPARSPSPERNPPAASSTPSWSRPTPTTTPAAGAEKKPLTWSERQAAAKKQRDEEDAAAGAQSLEFAAKDKDKDKAGNVFVSKSAAVAVGAGAVGVGLAKVVPRFDDDDEQGKEAPDWDDDEPSPAARKVEVEPVSLPSLRFRLDSAEKEHELTS